MDGPFSNSPWPGSALPTALLERAVELSPGPPREGEFVLYWAHHALRAHENPALEAAAHIALQQKLPLLVYQGLGGRHRYNADRHHRFILESARDFAGQLAAVGQRLVFHLPTEPAAPSPLGNLLARAALAVSELYPVPPFRAWYEAHARNHPQLPWLLVDASCVLPMPTAERRPARAFHFRRAHEAELRKRAKRPWTVPAAWPESFTQAVGFEPFDFATSLEDAIARCQIDHSVPPVSDTPGGSTAGYSRWSTFLARGLDSYHRLRDDAALPEAVSRMSAYLHYGCVSPLRIAREALAHGGEGAEKFLDELLIWRELSHHFCYHCENPETLEALPEWASDTLRKHRAVIPKTTLDWETLLRGRSGEPLWDLAQRSLLRRGELHNNVRMSWGKAFLPWAPRPERALKLMIDLNHRLALDGSDPNSYGGLLWCLGQFDRPFPPAEIFGSIRRRSLARHAARLDIDRFAGWVSRPAGGLRMRVAIVGAGLAGLTAARILEDQGHDVTVVEKARGAGGRMSSRRHQGWLFDHGAQYFTARDARFRRHVLAWRERGRVGAWNGRIGVIGHGAVTAAKEDTERFVPLPSMSAICREVAAGLSDCRFEWRLKAAALDGAEWQLNADDGRTVRAEALILTVPPEQAGPLLADSVAAADARQALLDIEMLPTWAVLAVLDRPLLEDWDAAFVNDGPLAWICSQAAKPGRPDAQAWVLHARPEWSKAHLDADPARVADQLLAAAAALPGARKTRVEYSTAHRWRYAQARRPLDAGALWLEKHRLALAGDWCHGSSVEGAFLSGAAAAGRLLGSAYAQSGRV